MLVVRLGLRGHRERGGAGGEQVAAVHGGNLIGTGVTAQDTAPLAAARRKPSATGPWGGARFSPVPVPPHPA
jgi:hypothetical protein